LNKTLAVAGVIALLSLGAAPAQAQIGLTILGGGYVPGSDFQQLRDAAQDRRVARESTLGLGANVELGFLRLSAAYATGATLSEEGVQNGDDFGDGSVLAAAAGLVLRPIPRLLVLQPYLLGGIGVKRERFSFDGGIGGNPFTRDESGLAGQIGVGADVMLGPIGVVAEITDYVSRRDGSFGPHDAFVMIGLKVRL
jgi:opacity protein-like surface antigen